MSQQDPLSPPALYKPPVFSPDVKEDIEGYLRFARKPGDFGTYQLPNTLAGNPNYYPIYVPRPTYLRFVSSDMPVTENGPLSISYFPENNPDGKYQTLTGSTIFGIDAQGPDIYLWTPGKWWLTIRGAATGWSFQYMPIPTEDPSSLLSMLVASAQRSQGAIANTDTVLAAATLTRVLDLRDVIRSHRLIIQNNGANPVRLSFGNLDPTATRGISLATGERLDLGPDSMALASLRAISTAGTSLGIHRWLKSNNF